MKQTLYLGLTIVILATGYLWLNHHRATLPHQRQEDEVEQPRSDALLLSKESKMDTPSDASHNEPTKQEEPSAVLNAGGLSMGLAFEGSNTDTFLSQFISNDLNRIFGHLKNNELLEPEEKLAPVSINGQFYAVTSVINFIGKGRFIPDRLEPFTGRIIQRNGRRELVVGKEMQELYRAAQTVAKQHADIFDSLPEFVARLNRLSEVPPTNLEEVIYFGNLSDEEAKAVEKFGPAQLVQAFGGKDYRVPSILEIQASTTLHGADANTWIVPLFVAIEGGISDAAPTAVYHNGRWKLLFSSSTL